MLRSAASKVMWMGGAKTLTLGLALLVALSLGLVLAAKPAHAATFTVNSTADPGDGTCNSTECTLREAITAANAAAGADTVDFSIPGTGVHTISPTSALPDITGPVIINGYSQPGATANTNGPGQGSNAVLRVELNGSGAGAGASGLVLAGGNSTVKGLAINRFNQYGIRLAGGNGYAVEGNFLGTNAAGDTALGNGLAGLLVNTLNNGVGNIIGGTTPAARNVISGNGYIGVWVHTHSPNLVQNNFIGTDKNGTADLGNTGNGVSIRYGSDNVIGGATPAARNVISGNSENGVQFNNGTFGGTMHHNYVRGNYIGTDVTGTNPLGNSGNGVHLDGRCGTVRDNVVGGPTAGEGNVVAFNSQSGVNVSSNPCSNSGYSSSAFGNSILSNSIFSNGGLGIDLGATGVTSNDSGDGDTGPNNLQNFPVLATASSSGGKTTVTGTLNSTANTTFDVQVFSSPAADPSGNGEGKTVLDRTTATTDGSGNASFSLTTTASTVGQVVTATATSPSGDTSEFSAAKTVAPAPPMVQSVSPTGKKVSPNANVTAAFSEAMNADTLRNPGTLKSTTFTLKKKGSAKAISARVTYDPNTKKATLDPTKKLRSGATYLVKVTTAAKDLAGNALDQDPNTTGEQPKSWTFRVRK